MARRWKAFALASLASVATMFVPMALTSLPDEGTVSLQGVATMLLMIGAMVVLVGWPAFLILRRLTWLNARTIGLAGFLIAGLPSVLASCVARDYRGHAYSGLWHGRQVDFIVNNELTTYGWLSYAESSLLGGLIGMLGGLAFYYVWRRAISHIQA